MFCTKCGNKNENDSIFCTSCGAKLEPAEVEEIVPETAQAVESDRVLQEQATTPVNNQTAGNEPDESSLKDESVDENAENTSVDVQFNADDLGGTTVYNQNAQYQRQSSSNQQQSQQLQQSQQAQQTQQYGNYYSQQNYTDTGAYYTAGAGMPGYTYPLPVRKKSKALPIILAVIIVLLLACGAVFAAYQLGYIGGGAKSEETTVVKDNPIVEPAPEDIPKEDINPMDEEVVRNAISSNVSYTDVGVYVKNLKTGYEFGLNENNRFAASAMVQVVILDALAEKVKNENLDIDSETKEFDYYSDNGKQAPGSNGQAGDYLPLRRYIEDVAVYGDNNKSNNLMDYIGRTEIRTLMMEKGYTGTEVNRKIWVGRNSHMIDQSASPNMTTPKDIANIFNDLVNDNPFGSGNYMKSHFKLIGGSGESIGLKRFASGYDVWGANGVNSQSTNDVAIFSDGDTEVVVAILCCTDEYRTGVETEAHRSRVQKAIVNHVLETQFK